MTTRATAELHPFLTSTIGRWIGGRVVESASGKVFGTINPATGQELAQLAEGDVADVGRAARAARAVFEGPWPRRTPYRRGIWYRAPSSSNWPQAIRLAYNPMVDPK